MNEIAVWAVIAGVFFLSSVVLFFISIVRKIIRVILLSVALLFASIGAGGCAAYLAIKRSHKELPVRLKTLTDDDVITFYSITSLVVATPLAVCNFTR